MLTAYISDSGDKRDARRLLALALREECGIPLPEIAKDINGKPFFPARPDIHFSLSHTKTHVMAVLGDAPCGCDTEAIRPLRSGVAERVCAPEELDCFDFFSCWVLKESFLKVTGVPRPLDTLRFTKRDGQIITPDPAIAARLYDVEGCRAAVCGAEPLPGSLIFIPAKNLT